MVSKNILLFQNVMKIFHDTLIGNLFIAN